MPLIDTHLISKEGRQCSEVENPRRRRTVTADGQVIHWEGGEIVVRLHVKELGAQSGNERLKLSRTLDMTEDQVIQRSRELTSIQHCGGARNQANDALQILYGMEGPTGCRSILSSCRVFVMLSSGHGNDSSQLESDRTKSCSACRS